jgi:hypothetical protein
MAECGVVCGRSGERLQKLVHRSPSDSGVTNADVSSQKESSGIETWIGAGQKVGQVTDDGVERGWVWIERTLISRPTGQSLEVSALEVSHCR